MNAQNTARTNSLSSRPFYTRLAALGFLLIALTGLISSGIAVISGNTGELSFVLVILVIGLLVAGLLLRFGAWAHVIAGLLSLLLLAAVLPFSLFNLQHPEDGSDFIPLVLLIAGAVLGLAGSVVGLIQRRKKVLRTAATHTERLALRIVLAALALVSLVSLGMTVMARTTLSSQARSNAVIVEIKDYEFHPDNIQVKTGETVRLAIKNSDTALHTFTLKEAGVDVSIPPGAERLIEFQALAPGTYQWYCIPHSSPGADGMTGMVGSLIVH